MTTNFKRACLAHRLGGRYSPARPSETWCVYSTLFLWRMSKDWCLPLKMAKQPAQSKRIKTWRELDLNHTKENFMEVLSYNPWRLLIQIVFTPCLSRLSSHNDRLQSLRYLSPLLHRKWNRLFLVPGRQYLCSSAWCTIWGPGSAVMKHGWTVSGQMWTNVDSIYSDFGRSIVQPVTQ